ncbi:hypothetical protein KVR01_003510 [Diaporthe batatas]|uniref:uncharacterized protein n=1 Tax=Diaporthe batatas TaxID=748121 RepID=UPI001D036F17|nr:uncharacterized protein KVR01_003510 [Diaporthe batatas]KAG8167821.1 hypothetical protein KVR01_003510 [Diaporthe batatas]
MVVTQIPQNKMKLVKIFFPVAIVTAASVVRGANSAIDTDVVIVGAGGSGTYAAVLLREDFGQRIVVVEKQNRLGGHTQTWHDPTTDQPFDYGVQVYTNLTTSSDFFERLNVPQLYADFATGKAVDYTPPSTTEVTDAMARWREQWLKYQDLLLPTRANFPTGDDIPQDLLLTWKDFARKYDLEALSPSIFYTVVVDLENALMIDIWKAYAFTGATTDLGLQPVSGDNSEVFEKAGLLLGSDVLYESQVVSAKRFDDGVQLVVKGKDGTTTAINAKRLLITIGPETMDQTVYDLDDEETDVFSSTFGNRGYTGVVSHPSLPARTVQNTAPGAIAANYLEYPDPPAMSSFGYLGNSSTGPIYRTVLIVPRDTEYEDAKSLVRRSLQNLMDAGTIPAGDVEQIDFREFHDHGRLYRQWSADQLRGGIVSRANALQGLRSTFYTGAFWMNNDCAMLWNTTASILPKVVAGI